MATREPPTTHPLLDLFPSDGEWTETEYYFVSERGKFVELSNGKLEFPPMPTEIHQLILMRLSTALFLFVTQYKMGQIRVAPLPVQLWQGKVREPDIIFMSNAHADRIQKYWGVPDLAIEIVSENDERRDRIIKKEEYAQAGIPEYWIVDPEAKTVEIYRLEGKTYQTHSALTEKDKLTSPTFPNFEISVVELFAENS
ncbi:MAG: Uma2 family endonuclease [Chloroflexi bacterium]|nr:Uma2 family endonuclease [Chloroflexota bacterium]MBI5714900.1 Uma2 family endonuclease [Chloroflexota bacterium]